MKKNKVKKTDNNFLTGLLSQFIDFDKDVVVLYYADKFWKEVSEKSHSSDIIKNSKCSDFKNGTLYIKTDNSAVKNEIFIKKSEIMGVINLYLKDKIGSKDFFIKRIIIR